MGPNDKQPNEPPEQDADGQQDEPHGEEQEANDEQPDKVQPARPLRPGESVGGYTHD